MRTNTEILNLIDSACQLAENGDICPLCIYIHFKEISDYLSDRIDIVKLMALKEAAKYKGDENGYCGYLVDVREMGGKYDYSNIEAIVKLKEQIKDLEKASQNAYKISLSKGMVVTGDGEEVQPAIYKAGTVSIALKLKKTLF
jgi:cellobiose phosphorylase